MIPTGFGPLDRVCGIEDRQPYVVAGGKGAGKTVFALTFLEQGLRKGETVALVTQGDVREVLECARYFGLSLTSSLQSGKLAIFEYPPEIATASRRLLDDSHIVAEFRALLGGMPVRRLVFDPVTPLLAGHTGEAAAIRFQTLVDAFSGLGAATLYVAETEDAAWLGEGASAIGGVLSLSSSRAGTHRLRLDAWRGVGRGSVFEYELLEGVGMTPLEGQAIDAARELLHLEESVAKPGAPRVLLVGFDEGHGQHLRSILSREYAIDQAFGPGDGIAYASERNPDVIVLAKETGRISGGAMARKLRQAGHNMPIVLIGRQLHRTADQANLLECGVDLCLDLPVHGRLLRLHIDNLLRRVGRIRQPLRTAEERQIPTPPLREPVNCTTRLPYFCERVEREMAYAAEFDLPLQVLSLRLSPDKGPAEDMSGTATMATRSTDLVFAGKHGVAVLLAEALSAEPFLNRFRHAWRGPAPVVARLEVTGKEELREALQQTLGGEAFGLAAEQAAVAGAQA